MKLISKGEGIVYKPGSFKRKYEGLLEFPEGLQGLKKQVLPQRGCFLADSSPIISCE